MVITRALLGEPGVAWLAAGVALIVLELLHPGAFLLWIGLAALGTGLVCQLVLPSFAVQVVIFAVLAPLSIAVAMTRRRKAKPASVNTPGSGLVARRAIVLHFEGREGRVRVGDSDWPARLAQGVASVGPEAMLDVVGVDGLVLLVKPIVSKQS